MLHKPDNMTQNKVTAIIMQL